MTSIVMLLLLMIVVVVVVMMVTLQEMRGGPQDGGTGRAPYESAAGGVDAPLRRVADHHPLTVQRGEDVFQTFHRFLPEVGPRRIGELPGPKGAWPWSTHGG